MVLDEPTHCALSVMTLIALTGPRGPRSAPEIAATLEFPGSSINRALRDLTAAHLLTVDLDPTRIGYKTTRPPSTVTIAEIIEAAHAPPDRTSPSDRSQLDSGPDRSVTRQTRPPVDSTTKNPSERARHALMAALGQVTLSDVLRTTARRIRD